MSPAIIRRPFHLLRLLVAAATFIILYSQIRTARESATIRYRNRARPVHPIDGLIKTAESTFGHLLAEQSRSLEEAAAVYRSRRGRHPPPSFNVWYEYASARGAVLVEAFFDQIYHDLEPFWGVNPSTIRSRANDFEMRISIRDGLATSSSNWFWTEIWLDLLHTLEHLLPDMDIPLNAMDEPRIVVPWEQMNSYLKIAQETHGLKDPNTVTVGFSGPSAPSKAASPRTTWETNFPYCPIARRACPPNSPARASDMPPPFDFPLNASVTGLRPHMTGGFVSNYTLSTDICQQPDLESLHGIFIEPLSICSTAELIPIFGGSKLSVNSDILVPAPVYWKGDERFTGTSEAGIPWRDKQDAAIWRGVATGGRTRESNWKGFQRHRFVSMNNMSQVTQPLSNTTLPDPGSPLTAQCSRRLGEWIGNSTDVAFTDLNCFPPEKDGTCSYMEEHFDVVDGVPMNEQFGYKYLPDIDGNSFSGRYLGFLRSTSLPIKATMFREWHDDRLVAWKHFVPMDNRFDDYYGILEYFIGARSLPSHDAKAEEIATAGKEWAARVLRKEDMQIYVLRLLLEYARVGADERARLAWIDDLKEL